MKFTVHAKVLTILTIDAPDEASARIVANSNLERLESRAIGLNIEGQDIEIVEVIAERVPETKLDRLREALQARQDRGHAYACKWHRRDGRTRENPKCDCGYAEAEALLKEIK